MGIHIQHVLHHLTPQRRLGSAKPRGNNAHGLISEAVDLANGERLHVVHLWKQRLAVEINHVHQGNTGEAHRKLKLPHLLHARRLKNYERVRVRVNTSNANLTNPGVLRRRLTVVISATITAAEMAVIKYSEGNDGTGVEHLPCILLVPARTEGVEDSSSANPFLAVFGDAISVGCAVAVAGLHRGEAGRAEDADFENTNREIPKLPCRRAGVAYIHGGFVHDVVGALEADAEVNATGEAELTPPRIGLQESPISLEVEPAGVDGAVVEPFLDGGERKDEAAENLVLAGRHAALTLRYPGLENLVTELGLGGELWRAVGVDGDDVLGFDDGDADVPELGGDVDLGADAEDSLALDCGGVGVPRLREGFVSLGPHPDGEHDFSTNFGIAGSPEIFKPVPLRRQGTVRSEDLVPLRGGFLLEVLGGAAVVSELHLDVWVDASGERIRGQVLGFDDADIEVVHLLHEIVGANLLVPRRPPFAKVKPSLL
ncbi:hypothetical protein IEQ34_012729 [Dendrobium chrysotoxum]|uniref:Uncharacterized protein n=1 Tax=Dendrobium chrysotoxum TaxID=161865 RepID=A0AAV7GPL1_DENCH|nr:hypothetical protein IEQ34_012729 [Dendrobium chrysotoxum]